MTSEMAAIIETSLMWRGGERWLRISIDGEPYYVGPFDTEAARAAELEKFLNFIRARGGKDMPLQEQ